ncbi:MAG: Ig-like domain-containing protein, partial [Bdellovibrionales bacterium]
SFTLSDNYTFPSDDVPAPINPWTTTVSYLTINQDITIADLNLQLNITYPYTDNLEIALFDPAGDGIYLKNGSWFSYGGANMTDTIFDDEAAQSIASGSAPFNGSYQPVQALSAFDSANAKGTWELWVTNYGFNYGTLNSWSLTIQPAGSTPPPTNNPPVAKDDSAITNEDTAVKINVLANDSDPDGDALSVVQVSSVTHGTATINADNTITFTPAKDYNGPASFVYTISDGKLTANATVNITVNPVNDAPVAANDTFSTTQNVAKTMTTADLLANDKDVDGDTLSVVSVSNPVNGTVSFSNGQIVFTPNTNFTGQGTFKYTIADGKLNSTATVTINVTGGSTGTGNNYYFSTTTSGFLYSPKGGTVSFTPSDIVNFNLASDGTYSFSKYFLGSNVGLTTSSEDMDAFTIMSDGSILVSTLGSFSVPGPNNTVITGGGEDILRFTPTSLGNATAGTWSMYFDGSDVGLGDVAGENINALGILKDGTILISTSGNVNVPGGVSGQNEDILAFHPSSLGDTTVGYWTTYFDGTDVGLSSADVDGFSVTENSSGITTVNLTFANSFLTNQYYWITPADIGSMSVLQLGDMTIAYWAPKPAFAGSQYGLSAYNIDGIYVGTAPGQTASSAATSASSSGYLTTISGFGSTNQTSYVSSSYSSSYGTGSSYGGYSATNTSYAGYGASSNTNYSSNYSNSYNTSYSSASNSALDAYFGQYANQTGYSWNGWY